MLFAIDADEAAEPGSREVACADEGAVVDEAVDDLLAGLEGDGVVPVEAVGEVRVFGVNRGDDDVAEDEAAFVAGGDDDAGVARGVARRGDGGEAGRDGGIAFDEVNEAGGAEWEDIAMEGAHPRLAGVFRLLSLGLVVVPVGFGYEVAGVGENRPAALAVDVPAGVVAVEVGEEDVGDFAGLDAGFGEFGEELALVFGAPASVDEEDGGAVADEERREVEGDCAVGGEVAGEGTEVPRVGVNGGGGVGLFEVDEGGHFDGADGDFLHGGSLASAGSGNARCEVVHAGVWRALHCATVLE